MKSADEHVATPHPEDIKHLKETYYVDPLATAGMNTTPDMWEMVSDALDGVALPASINTAIYALCAGGAEVVLIKDKQHG